MQKFLTLNTGYAMPTLGFGTWNATKEVVAENVAFAITEAGYRHIDCASIYGNEKEVGTAFNSVLQSKKVKRDELFITSKLWNTEHHPDRVEKACRQTLSDLQLDYLDLYLIHWGVPFLPGAESSQLDENGVVKMEPVSVRETWEAMGQLVEKGLVRSIGVANFTTMMLLDLLTNAKVRPAVNQIELHPYNTQKGLVNYCQQQNIVVTAYSPLANPSRPQAPKDKLLENEVIGKIALAHSCTPAQVVLNWGVSRNTIVIPKASSKERIIENAVIFSFELTDQEREQISALNQNYRIVDPAQWWGIPYFE